jgi:hypothetical protein
MKLLLALMLMFLTAASAQAMAEKLPVGPYVVSFNLNTEMSYNLTTRYFAENASTSVAEIGIRFDNDTSALIDIFNDSEWQYAGTTSCCTVLKSLALKDDPNTMNYTVSQRMIDGKIGDVVTKTYKRPSDGKVLNATMAEYWPDSREIEGYNIPAGKTKVELIAVFPENMSESLLNTLHVELPVESAQLSESSLLNEVGEGAQNNAIEHANVTFNFNIANNTITIAPYFVNQAPLGTSPTNSTDFNMTGNPLASLGISPEMLSSPEAMKLSKILAPSAEANASGSASELGKILPISALKSLGNTTEA